MRHIMGNNKSVRREDLLSASKNGDYERVEYLLKKKKIDVNVSNSDYETPLHLACQNNHFEIVKLLIDHGANLEACRDFSDHTPFHYACENGHENIIKLLVENGVNIHARVSAGNSTALYILAQNNESYLLRYLMYQGLEPEYQDIEVACEEGNLAAVDAFMDYITERHSKNITIETLQQLLTQKYHFYCYAKRTNEGIREKMNDAILKINEKNKDKKFSSAFRKPKGCALNQG